MCLRHFKPEEIVKTKTRRGNFILDILPDAVPSVFEGYPEQAKKIKVNIRWSKLLMHLLHINNINLLPF